MEKILEKWTERHCTDSDSISGNNHYIEHKIYIASNGCLIHDRSIYKWNGYDGYEFVKCTGTTLAKGLK